MKNHIAFSKYYIVIVIIFISCGTPKPVTQSTTKQSQPKETRINNKYILESQFGHKIEVELDYTVGQTGYINNGCRAQYILTNIGKIPIDDDTEFTTGAGTNINTVRFDSTYKIGKVVFEFTTSDNKKIEKSEHVIRSSIVLPPGKSLEAEDVSIDAGNRFCISVKPVRIDMERGLRVGSNQKRK